MTPETARPLIGKFSRGEHVIYYSFVASFPDSMRALPVNVTSYSDIYHGRTCGHYIESLDESAVLSILTA